jgi:hypothetical protein
MIIKAKGMNELLAKMDEVADNLPKEVNIVLGISARKVQSRLSKEIGRELNTPQKNIKRQTSREVNRQRVTATVKIRKSARIPLRDFKARQTKQGVSAKISKRKGVKKYRNSFIIARFGNHAFTRGRNPKNRKITKMMGPSPWGVIVRNNRVMDRTMKWSKIIVLREMKERVRYLTRKKAGGLNWQQKG